MQYRKHLREGSVHLDCSFRNLEDALDFLSEKFSHITGQDQSEILQLLEQREALGSTWIGHNTMMPHSHSPKISHLNMIFIRCQHPLILDDGQEIKYIFAILTSGSEDQLYLSILQGISRLIKEKTAELDSCKTPAEIFALLESCDFMAGKALVASDLAESWPTVCKTDSLSRALDLMKTHGVYMLPVLGGQGQIEGVIDLLDLLKAGFPDYVFSLNDLSMLQDFQPLKHFWNQEDQFNIEEHIRDHKSHIISAEATYPEIFFVLVKSKHRHLIVLNEEGQFKGVISPNHIINTMLRP